VAWLESEERAGHAVPHVWSFTSDSIAAHAAKRLGAARLTLLKSTLPETMRGGEAALSDAAAADVVDAELPRAAVGLPCVELVNLRVAGTQKCRLREDA